MRKHVISATLLVVLLTAGISTAQVAVATPQVTKPAVAGVTNFARLETTIACAGATTPAGVAEVKKLGYKTIINLRQASEPGADIDAEAAAAKAAGINFVHLPFNAASPDPTVVDNFLKTIANPRNNPAFLHCASANRVGALVALDHAWTRGGTRDDAIALGRAAGMAGLAPRVAELLVPAASR